MLRKKKKKRKKKFNYNKYIILSMKKTVIILLIILLLATTIKLPDTGITGFFVKIGITGLALAKEIVKTVLNFILKLLG